MENEDRSQIDKIPFESLSTFFRLTTQVVDLLLPALPHWVLADNGTAKKVESKALDATWGVASEIWEILFPYLRTKQEAVANLRDIAQDVAAPSKQDETHAALQAILLKILIEKPSLALQIEKVLHQYWLYKSRDERSDKGGLIAAGVAFPPIPNDKSRLRMWWHQILGHYDRYPSYAMLLALPSDSEAIQYLKEYGRELHLISGDSCLVITLTGLGFMQYGSDDAIMPLTIDESIAEGYCLKAAELFSVGFDEFPCLLLFQDIRKPEHILVSLKGLNVGEIAQEMRTLFSIVSEAVKQGKNPVISVGEYNNQHIRSQKVRSVWRDVQGVMGKTLETMMEAFIKANIK